MATQEEKAMLGYLVFSESYPAQVAAIAQSIETFLREQGINCSTEWYYDDDVDGPTEYGVKIEISGRSPETAHECLHSIWRRLAAAYTEQEVRLEL